MFYHRMPIKILLIGFTKGDLKIDAIPYLFTGQITNLPYLYISGSSDARWLMSTSPLRVLRIFDKKKLANGNSVNMFS